MAQPLSVACFNRSFQGDFIRELQRKKGLTAPIPVSCFTATAKQKVISDIRDYFKQKLGLEQIGRAHV